MSNVDEKLLIERYIRGEKVRRLAQDYAVSLRAIYAVLKKNGVTRREAVGSKKISKLLSACRDGAIIAIAARRFGLSERTASRAVREYRRQGGVIEAAKGRPTLSRLHRIQLAEKPRNKREGCVVDIEAPEVLTAYTALRTGAFPYPEKLPASQIAHEFARMRVQGSHLEDNVIRPRTHVGLRLCLPFFPNRYHAISNNKMSSFDAWHTESELKRAIQLQIRYGDPTTAARVLRAITLRCRTPTIFRPAVAKFVCERYCPVGGRVYDPCAGFGGRLLGAAAAGVHYVGTDVEPETVEGNNRLAAAIGIDAKVHLSPAEIFTPPEVDLVFTSPPYFDREKYSNLSTQSWRSHNSLDAWVAGFLRPVAERSFAALVVRGYFVLNISDLKGNNNKIVPLVSLTIQTALAAGFEHVETLRMPLAAINRTDPSEPVLVFRKL